MKLKTAAELAAEKAGILEVKEVKPKPSFNGPQNMTIKTKEDGQPERQLYFTETDLNKLTLKKYTIKFTKAEFDPIDQHWLDVRMDKFSLSEFDWSYDEATGHYIYTTDNSMLANFLVELSSGGMAGVEWMEEQLGVTI